MTTIKVYNSQTKEVLKEEDYLSTISPRDFRDTVKEILMADPVRTKAVKPDVAEICNEDDTRLDLEPTKINLDGVMREIKMQEKWREVLTYAKEHATGEGLHKGFRWLEDAFNEYFEAHEEMVEKHHWPSFGGPSWGSHNRTVMAGKIANELRYIRDEEGFVKGLGLTNEQLDKLTDTLQGIVERDPREIKSQLKI